MTWRWVEGENKAKVQTRPTVARPGAAGLQIMHCTTGARLTVAVLDTCGAGLERSSTAEEMNDCSGDWQVLYESAGDPLPKHARCTDVGCH
jgi:hypothetical protein